MSPPRAWAVFRKELLHIRRDPSSLVQIILMPVMLLLLYGYALTFDIKQVPTVVWDRDGSAEARQFLNRLFGSPYFQDFARVGEFEAGGRMLDQGAARVVVGLPQDFGRQVKTEGQAKVSVVLDGADANTANVILGYIQAVVSDYNLTLMTERLHQKGLTRLNTPISPEPRVWYNEELESRNFIVPGLIVVIMTMVGALLTSLSVVRERERGSMEGLIASPLKKSELILGKLGPYFIIGMVDMAIAMGMGQFLFEVPMRGSWLLMIAMSALYLMVMLAQGLLISFAAQNQLQANQLSMLSTFLPALLLSGFMFDVRQMPWALELISYVVPARYFVTLTKGIYLKGLGLDLLWPSAVLLVGFALLFLLLAARRFSKKVR